MRNVVWFLLLFVVAVVAATTFGANDGVVSIYWAGWRTDLSLNLFVIAVITACFVLMMAAHAIGTLISLPRRAAEWRALRRERASQAALREGLAEYFAARYSRAHKAANRALSIQADTPELAGDREFTVLGHLIAAGSLHKLQDRPRRDGVMKRLLSLLRQGSLGRGAEEGARLLAAEWAVDDRDAARAIELLGELPPGVARRTQALRLRLQAARLARQPLDALHTARLLANHQAFSPVAAQGLLRSLAAEAIDATHDGHQLERLWEQFDAADRRDAFVVARAATRAAALGEAERGRRWLLPFWDRLADLSHDDREQIALALADAVRGIGSDWLPRLETALTTFGHEPAVVAAVGTAFAERQLWGKARRLLEAAGAAPALPPRARRSAWRLLAGLARNEGDEAKARGFELEAAGID